MSVTTFTTVNGMILSQAKDGVVSHFVPDPLGSVVMVRDTSGNTVYKAEYDPYGNVQSETGTNPSSLGYVGTLSYIKDSATSMYVRARYLLNNLGRWLTKDPLWPSEAGYVYAGAAPNMRVDPSGLQLIEIGPPKPWVDIGKGVIDYFIRCIGSLPHECGSYPGGPCAYAEKVGDVGPKDAGGVVCCNGEAYPCVWKWGGIGSPEGIKKCIWAHEVEHVGQPGVCPSRKYGRGIRTGPDAECKPSSIEINCLVSKRQSECGRMPPANRMVCEKLYRKRICEVCRYMADFSCNPKPRNCDFCS